MVLLLAVLVIILFGNNTGMEREEHKEIGFGDVEDGGGGIESPEIEASDKIMGSKTCLGCTTRDV